MIQFTLIFVHNVMRNQGSNVYPLNPELFLEKTILTVLKCSSAFVLNQENGAFVCSAIFSINFVCRHAFLIA